jgi:hypothetical protein
MLPFFMSTNLIPFIFYLFTSSSSSPSTRERKSILGNLVADGVDGFFLYSHFAFQERMPTN